MRGRLALKRPAPGVPGDESKRRTSTATQQQAAAAAPPASQPTGGAAGGAGGSWASDFAAEVNQARQQAQQELGTAPPLSLCGPSPDLQQQPGQASGHLEESELEVVPESSDGEAEEDSDHAEEEREQQQGQQLAAAAGPAAAAAAAAPHGAALLPVPPASPPSPPPPPEAGRAEERQGLAKVVESMRRRVDAGRLQLEGGRRLERQKRALLSAGGEVLEQHCRASWQQGQQQGQQQGRETALEAGQQKPRQAGGGEGGVRVHSLQAECAAGQWRLRAVVSLPAWQHCQPHARRSAGTSDIIIISGPTLSLLAASTVCRLVCRQQQCMEVAGSSNEEAPAGNEEAPSGSPLLQLTAALEVEAEQPPQQGAAGPAETAGQLAADAWADVFLLQERGQAAGRAEADSSLSAALSAPPAAPPVLLGRVRLSSLEWLRSHSRPLGDLGPQVRPPQQAQHQRRLAAELCEHQQQQPDLRCLHDIVCKQLGLLPAAGAACRAAEPQAPAGSGSSSSSSGVAPTQSYVLPGPAVLPGKDPQVAGEAAAAAVVCITVHSSSFAEVELQASSTHLLDVLHQQLGAGLQAAARAAGAPEGSVKLGASLASPQHAQQAAAAAEALVRELDASIEWLQALLKEKLALGSLQRRQRCPPDPAGLRARQAAALAAMAACDASMAQLLRS